MDKGKFILRRYVMEDPGEALGTAIGVSFISAFPVFGGPVVTLLSSYQMRQMEIRFKDLFNGLATDLEGKFEQIDKDFVSKEDFIGLFMETSDRVVRTRTKEKRDKYKNLLKNSMIKPIPYDEIEEWIDLLNILRNNHLIVLSIFHNPRLYDSINNIGIEEDRRKNSKSGLSSNISLTMRKMLPELNEIQIKDIVYKLINERLVKDILQGYTRMIRDIGIAFLENHLTEKGKRFCEYIFE